MFLSLNIRVTLQFILFVMIPSRTKAFSFTFRTLSTTTRQRYPILSSMSTRYTINDEVCAPIDEAELRKIVQKHCRSLNIFLDNRPIAAHTKDAFDQIYDKVDPSRDIILDSGTGTGRSTLLLGEMYPEHTVIGVDRSFTRLSRNALENEKAEEVVIATSKGESHYGNSDSDTGSSQRPFQALSSNVFLVRAELTDFWRLMLQTDWNVSHHYMLYPNPYPKKNRIKKRFYAHPSFPLILQLGGQIVLRSNWEGYLKEFTDSVVYADEFYQSVENSNFENVALKYVKNATIGPKERIDKSIAWTNFEKKYDDVGEKTYELVL
mmetsp:Transcript_6259/g.7934  ORF Transcript_6259/g.7934 Transcript_6259/m.7934 type:complete len:321 (-) Transcript_6259:45-1007(-)